MGRLLLIILLFLSTLNAAETIDHRYELCNVTHIQFIGPDPIYSSFGNLQDYDIYGLAYATPNMYLRSQFIANHSNFIYLDNYSDYDSLYFKLSESNVTAYFNGITGYYLRNYEGCAQNPYIETEFGAFREPFFTRYSLSQERYNVPTELYWIQQVKKDGIDQDLSNLNISQVMNQMPVCDGDYIDLVYLNNIHLVVPQKTSCRQAYIFHNTDVILDKHGAINNYPGTQLFELYNLAVYSDEKIRQLKIMESQIPQWKDFANLSTQVDCTNRSLSNLTERMQLISELESNLSNIKENTRLIVPQDYQYRVIARNLKKNESTYYYVDKFLPIQAELLNLIADVENKIKLSRDMHKDFVSICIQKSSFENALEQNKNSLEESKKANDLQWLGIIFAVTVPFVIYFLDPRNFKITFTPRPLLPTIIVVIILALITILSILFHIFFLFICLILFLFSLILGLIVYYSSNQKKILFEKFIEKNVPHVDSEILLLISMLFLVFSYAFLLKVINAASQIDLLSIALPVIVYVLFLLYLSTIKRLNENILKRKKTFAINTPRRRRR